MLDLKAKLAAAGVVTPEQIEKVEAQQARRRRGDSSRRRRAEEGRARRLVDIDGLRNVGKGEAYHQIRKLVEKHRLDAHPSAVPTAEAQPFGFTTSKGGLRQLLLEPSVHAAVVEGRAAISAYVSDNGVAHCVLPTQMALDLAELFPLWLRKLAGSGKAGKLESPPQPPNAG
ncbi:MAG: hypothetical protein V3V08_07585 [Nannocystaceae bacterium]